MSPASQSVRAEMMWPLLSGPTEAAAGRGSDGLGPEGAGQGRVATEDAQGAQNPGRASVGAAGGVRADHTAREVRRRGHWVRLGQVSGEGLGQDGVMSVEGDWVRLESGQWRGTGSDWSQVSGGDWVRLESGQWRGLGQAGVRSVKIMGQTGEIR